MCVLQWLDFGIGLLVMYCLFLFALIFFCSFPQVIVGQQSSSRDNLIKERINCFQCLTGISRLPSKQNPYICCEPDIKLCQLIPHWWVKSSGIRQSKIYKFQLALMGGKGLKSPSLLFEDPTSIWCWEKICWPRRCCEKVIQGKWNPRSVQRDLCYFNERQVSKWPVLMVSQYL